MRVLGVVPLYPPVSRVGAWLATHQHFAYLAAQGHNVVVYAFLATRHEWEIDGVTVHGADSVDTDQLARNCDVVIGHCGDALRSHRIARRARRTLIQLFHGMPAAPSADASLIVFNSQTSLEQSGWRGPAEVCRPWTDPTAHHVDATGAEITIVNCSIEKGVKVAWRIAEQMPDLRFLGVLGGYGEQVKARAPNFTVLPIQYDMRNVWARTRILLMPSLRESWGMVGVEAIASGIPVLATDLPGPREALGDAATYLPRDDIDAWVTEVRRLTNSVEWAAASARAFARSAQLAAGDSRPHFAELVQQYARPKAVFV